MEKLAFLHLSEYEKTTGAGETGRAHILAAVHAKGFDFFDRSVFFLVSSLLVGSIFGCGAGTKPLDLVAD